jgi:hypothetical protein
MIESRALPELLPPIVIDYTPMKLQWDDSYFLTYAVCLRNAIYGWHGGELRACLNINKSPFMIFLGIPWGAVTPLK